MIRSVLSGEDYPLAATRVVEMRQSSSTSGETAARRRVHVFQKGAREFDYHLYTGNPHTQKQFSRAAAHGRDSASDFPGRPNVAPGQGQVIWLGFLAGFPHRQRDDRCLKKSLSTPLASLSLST